MRAATISEIGLREAMEDCCYLDLDFAGKGWVFAGVYDGHRGDYAANYVKERLHRVFMPLVLSGAKPQDAFIKAYEQTSNELASQESGTTAVNLYIADGRIYAANAGDARAVLVKTDGVRQLTFDHRLDSYAERQRIVKMGGQINYPYTMRGPIGLMPTRTIGDEYFKEVGIIATPSVREHAVSPNDILALAASDGLFDVMDNDEVAAFARKIRDPHKLIHALAHEALHKRGARDNITIAAISLQESKKVAERFHRVQRLIPRFARRVSVGAK